MRNIIKIIALSFFALLLSACLTERPIKTPPASDNASVKLSEAATSVSQSLHELGRIQAEASPPMPNGRHLVSPDVLGLQGAATVDWSGPIKPLLKRLCHVGNYRLRILGKQPAIPVIVTVVAHNAPLAVILRDIDFQAGKRADIVAYPNSRTIELRYAKA